MSSTELATGFSTATAYREKRDGQRLAGGTGMPKEGWACKMRESDDPRYCPSIAVVLIRGSPCESFDALQRQVSQRCTALRKAREAFAPAIGRSVPVFCSTASARSREACKYNDTVIRRYVEIVTHVRAVHLGLVAISKQNALNTLQPRYFQSPLSRAAMS